MTEQTTADVVREYLSRMAEIRGTGGATKETSYYSALENLLNQFGKTLKPQVICNGQLHDQGADNPDFGLYTRSQIQGGEPLKGQLPERGVIEVKGLSDSTLLTAKSVQVSKYFGLYRLVLVTNYREFRLIGDDGNSKPIELDRYSLAEDEITFWGMTAKPGPAVERHGVHFAEFLQRVMMIAAPLTRAEDVAWFLASYARDAMQTLNEKDSSALDPLRKSLETALGVRFLGIEGEHFFRSTLVQTLFYGIFSAWVVHAKQSTERFDWKSAVYILTVPMVKALFEQIALPSKLGALGLMPILDRTAEALNRIDQTLFFKTFNTDEAVQHFYEPFLQAYDPELRKSLGVWYTPREIVNYMVERVDQVLRSELGRPNGLADKDVYVLDPCCGTGAYVVAVLRKIEETLKQQGSDAFLADDIKQAARERVFGFELMSAPYVIAHWQVGNFLTQLGAPLDVSEGERAAIYLTNSLTGWEPPKGPKANLPLFPELEQERDAAERVKRKVPILVVIGNPPYNAFAGTSPEEEHGLVDVYKEGLHKKWGIKKYNLDELYVRFMRLAQRRITEGTKQGVVCFVSSFSYLADPSFVVMRERLLNDFDNIWIDSLNGDSRETGKKTPTGEPDPSVFSTQYNPAGIRLGTTIGLFTRKQAHKPAKSVRYRDFWGKSKRADLLSSLTLPASNSPYVSATPTDENRFSFRPHSVSKSFQEWPKIIDLCAIAPIPGLQEMRFGALMSMDKEILKTKISHYLDPSRTWTEVVAAHTGPTLNAGRFDAMESRETILKKETFAAENVRRYSLYPFDNRWAYWSSVRPMWNEPRPALVAQSFPENQFFISRMSAERPNEGIPATVTTALPDYHLLRPNVAAIPFVVETPGQGLFAAERAPNLSTATLDYLKAIKVKPGQSDLAIGRLVWLHALAICYSPQYLHEHRDGILGDWPRIPMPASLSLLEASSKLGATLSDLLNPDVALAGITDGAIDILLLKFGVLSRVDEKPLKPNDLAVTAGWGHRTKKGIVMPGSGRIKERDQYTEGELAGLNEKDLQVLGSPIDIMLNDVASLRTIPANVWNFRIGGYQVIKKWLSYREGSVLGRSLTKDEAREITYMVRRISAIILMTSKLNANYVAVRDNSFAWTHATKAGA